jgi:hypothetical protein
MNYEEKTFSCHASSRLLFIIHFIQSFPSLINPSYRPFQNSKTACGTGKSHFSIKGPVMIMSPPTCPGIPAPIIMIRVKSAIGLSVVTTLLKKKE